MSLSSPESTANIEVALAAMDQEQTPWLLLRGVDSLQEPDGDTDILVPANAVKRLRSVLTRAGYVPVVAAGHAPHAFFVAWSRDHWVRLDAVTEVRWGDLTMPGLAEEVLARRTTRAQWPKPHPEDAFWLLFMHCAADKRAASLASEDTFKESRWQELVELAPHVGTSGPVAEQMRVLGLDLQGALSVIRDADREAAAGYAAEADLAVQARVGRSRAVALRQWRRLARRGGGRLAGRGLFVAVMGPDGSGKSTLVSYLAEEPVPHRVIYGGLPRPGRFASRLHALPLGYFAQQVGQTVFRSLRAQSWRSRGRIVFTDRHTLDTLAAPDREWISSREQCKRAVVRRLAPNPDLILVLDAPAQVLFDRKPESSLGWSEQLRAGFLSVAQTYPQATVIDVQTTISVVQHKAQDIVWAAVVARQGD